MMNFSKIINSTKLSFSLDKNLIKEFVDLSFENAICFSLVIVTGE